MSAPPAIDGELNPTPLEKNGATFSRGTVAEAVRDAHCAHDFQFGPDNSDVLLTCAQGAEMTTRKLAGLILAGTVLLLLPSPPSRGRE